MTAEIKVPPKTRKRKDMRERFMSKVYRCADGCWLWMGTKLKPGRRTTGGYGQFSVNNSYLYAHRVSYELHTGPIPAGAHVMHSCDVRHCVNPAHLSLGTRADNMADMVEKSRQANGERNGRHRLTDAQVAQIRSDRAAGMTQQAIADKHGTCCANVSFITRNLSRKKETCAKPQA